METNVAMQKWYEIVVEGSGIDYDIYWVRGATPHEALVNYCKYTGEFQGARMEAIMALCFDSAINLANEWVYSTIVNMHEIGDVVWNDSKNRITVIKGNKLPCS